MGAGFLAGLLPLLGWLVLGILALIAGLAGAFLASTFVTNRLGKILAGVVGFVMGIIVLLFVVGLLFAVGNALFGTTPAPISAPAPGTSFSPSAPGTSLSPSSPSDSSAVLGTGIPVKSNEGLLNGHAYVIRDIVWGGSGSAEVWVFSTSSFGDIRGNKLGPAWDNVSTTHVRDAWTSSTGAAWTSLSRDACKESQAVAMGSLGITNVVVHVQNGIGGWMSPPAVCQ